MSFTKLTIWTELGIRNCLYWLNPAILFFLIFRLVLRVNGYQDAETLIQASNSLSRRVNPYENEFFLNGYLLAIPAHIYNALFPVVTGARLYVLINIALIALLIWDLLRKRALSKIILVVIMVLASSPTRAMAASVQHTGIILGCSYISYRVASYWEAHTKVQKFLKYASVSFLLLIPMELKPQLMLPLIAMFIFHPKLRRYAISTLILASFAHLILSLYLQMPLDKYWLERLLSRSSETTGSESRENSPWTLIGDVFDHPRIWLGFSSVFFIVLIIGLVAITRKESLTENHFLLAFTIPLILTYIHPYDLIASVILVASTFVSDSKPRGASFLIALFLFPTIGWDLLSFFLSLWVFLFIWYTSGVRFSHWRKDGIELVSALLIYFLINSFTQDMGLRVNIHMSILILGSLIFAGARLVIPALEKNHGGSPGVH
jgi:hypothetical protein